MKAPAEMINDSTKMDAHTFYDKYSYEIAEMVSDWESETGNMTNPNNASDGDHKRYYADFAFAFIEDQLLSE